jgi:hypothetical protein
VQAPPEVLAMAAVLIVLGSVWLWVGWAAWTGRHRTWAARGRGYRWLMGVPSGAGLALMGAGALLLSVDGGEGAVGRVGGALFGLGVLAAAAGMLFMLSIPFVRDRFYPRWYHDLADDKRQW